MAGVEIPNERGDQGPEKYGSDHAEITKTPAISITVLAAREPYKIGSYRVGPGGINDCGIGSLLFKSRT